MGFDKSSSQIYKLTPEYESSTPESERKCYFLKFLPLGDIEEDDCVDMDEVEALNTYRELQCLKVFQGLDRDSKGIVHQFGATLAIAEGEKLVAMIVMEYHEQSLSKFAEKGVDQHLCENIMVDLFRALEH